MPSPDRCPAAGLAQAIAVRLPELLAAARQLVGCNDADDLVQNTIERALNHQASFQPNTNLMAWLRRIMSNLVVDSWRRENRHPRCSFDLSEHPAPKPEPAAEWEDLSAADVRDAISHLRPAFRQVFELYQRGVPYQEIARRLGIPVGTVGTRLLRGRARLKTILVERIAAGPDAGVDIPAAVQQLPLARRRHERSISRGSQSRIAGAA